MNINIHTVLVRPIYGRNVGQAARATMNMGKGKLILIDPKCEIESEARQGAAGAQKPLEEREVYETWESFNDQYPDSARIGLSRRIGKHRKLFPLNEGAKYFFKNNDQKEVELFLVFGPEDHGLATDDLDHVNMVCYLPLYGEFKSLNLAHAVLVSQHICHDQFFSLQREKPNLSSIENNKEDYLTQSVDPSFFPDDALKHWLTAMGFQIDPERLNAFETIRKMILRGFPSKKELGTFEKALRQGLRSIEDQDKS